ncbi:putative bifunctional diguanylate cyclase/phosphodiesterase [Roseateles koreensis]|uniref:putative bifunctional diguanylate cyclase/phosphodiesterase n=1 Tax=Roseateles koreensis TaxID=2987526 RepID=UPI002358A08E
MTTFIILGAVLNAMLGVALLLLWRQSPRQQHAKYWGLSWIFLSGALILGLGLPPEPDGSLVHDTQVFLAALCAMASTLLRIVGARSYRELPWQWRTGLHWFFGAMMLIVGLAKLDHSYGIVLAAVLLGLGALWCARCLWRGGSKADKWVAIGFMTAGLANFMTPFFDPFGRSVEAHLLGLSTQTALSLGLILLSVIRAHQETRQQAERFFRLAEHSLQGQLVIQNGRLKYANPAALAIYGVTNHMPLAAHSSLVERIVPEDERAALEQRHQHVVSDPLARIEWEGPRLTMDGRHIYVRGLSSHIEWDGAPAELMVMLDDSSRQRAVDELKRQALHDELTDLPNRNYAVERLRQITPRGAHPFALISADLDRFQLVNENLGHDMGDALLRAVARRLTQELPVTATVCRLGEDQFLVLLEGIGEPAEVQHHVQHLLDTLQAPFSLAGAELYAHMSIGVALFPRDGLDAPTLLRAADAAMHRAKSRAGAACVFFESAMRTDSRARLESEQAIGRAIALHEFVLEFQPKFQAHSRVLCGFEALVRWERPGMGRISPADFVPAAERTGQIKALGGLILDLAMRQLTEWQLSHGRLVPVAVNVSPLQFEDAAFAAGLLGELKSRKLPAEALEIEITETAAIAHLDQVLPQLQHLRTAGVLSALDDFGTGQSSLTLLRNLPISTMKLDRSMIEPLPEHQAAAVVKVAAALGQALQLNIVAEGVETEAQAQSAEALGCTQLQGYLLGKPLSADAAGALLSASTGTPRGDSMPTQPPSV